MRFGDDAEGGMPCDFLFIKNKPCRHEIMTLAFCFGKRGLNMNFRQADLEVFFKIKVSEVPSFIIILPNAGVFGNLKGTVLG